MGDIQCIPPGFHKDLAVELGNLVVAAYDQFQPPNAAIRPAKWPLSSPYRLVKEFSAALPNRHMEKFGFVAQRTDTGDVYVVFRGTQTPADWLANLDFLQVPQQHGWGKTEKGFSHIYDGCSPTIISALQNDLGSPAKVMVTGHSLGGSLATLCAADIRASLNATITLRTFASPRVGDSAFAAKFNQECADTWRIVNTEDIVNTLPLAATVVEVMKLPGLDTLARDAEHIPLIGERIASHLGFLHALLNGLDYEHVAAAVDFTQHNGNIVGNHEMETYLKALGAPLGSAIASATA
jgi:triacylglycerol lipase